MPNSVGSVKYPKWGEDGLKIDEGTEKGANLEKGKAFLQKLYDDLAKR